MLKITTIFVSLLFGMALTAQTTENRAISGFTSVKVQDGIELIFTQDENTSLTIEGGNAEVSSSLVTEVKDNELNIYNSMKQQYSQPVRVYLRAKDISSFEADSKATITLTSPLFTKDLRIGLSSGGTFKGTVKAEGNISMDAGKETVFNIRAEAFSLNGNFRSNSRINLCGIVKNVTLQTSGNAFCSSRNLIASNATINTEKNSSVLINVKEKISISIADSGRVTYTGNPKSKKWDENATATALNKLTKEEVVTLNYQNNQPSSKALFNQEKSK